MSAPLRVLRSRLLLVGTLLLSGGALAEDEDEDEASRTASARAVYARGVAAYDAGEFKDAIDLFLQANRIAPLPAFSFNIAVGYERMGDPARALQWYRDYERTSPPETDRAETSSRIAALERRLQAKGVQQATVLSIPAGATVVVDGQAVGVTPWTGELTPGGHRLELSLRGHADHQSSFELAAHRALDVEVALDAAPTGVV
ncbi:MAG: PEGA domain-containing protein, partial [Deltaproteobacteria bacterium]|nr:PEGA domain-containing protein [Deltaproteobacteria bacterium]